MAGEKINIITLNVNGLNNLEKADRLFHMLNFKKFDIILLQETKIERHKAPDLINLWYQTTEGGQAFFNPSETKGARGVAVLLANKLKNAKTKNIDTTTFNERAILMEIEFENEWFHITNVYAPNDAKNRKSFLQKIGEAMDPNKTNFLAGDFNFVENTLIDRAGGGQPNPDHTKGKTEIDAIKVVHKICDHYRFMDEEKSEFTYRANTSINTPTGRKTVTVMSRLDRLYIPQKYLNKAFTKIFPIDATFYGTDHYPVMTSFYPKNEQRKKIGKGFWKFPNYILEDKKYIEMMNGKIENFLRGQNEAENILDFWEHLKAMIQAWTRTHSDKVQKENQQMFQEARKSYNIEMIKRNPDQNKLALDLAIMAKEDRLKMEKIRIQIKQDIVEYDEQSSLYFYKKLEEKTKKASIQSLRDSQGNVQTRNDKILEIAHNFYQDLFDPSNTPIDLDIQDSLIGKIDKKIDQDQNRKLETDIKTKELAKALKSMKPRKTPGIDGLTAEFYKKFQTKLLPVLNKVAMYIQENKVMSINQKIAVIALIYKAGDEKDLKNFRPISLLCVDYKIISKAITNRIQTVMADLVEDAQTAGIKNRTIFNNLWLARDMFEDARIHGKFGYVFSLDQSKAFDMVNHDFMKKVMIKYGFGPKFMSYIDAFYNNTTSVIQNNGYFSDPINIKRGVRQGDSLSCYLYVLVAETLAISIRQDNHIQGYRLQDHLLKKDQISISLYADDTIIPLAKNNRKQSFTRVKERLKEYQLASGSKLNVDKSKIYVFGGKSEDENKSEADTLKLDLLEIGLDLEILPINNGIKLLGVIFTGDPIKDYKVNFQKAFEKIRKKITFLALRRLSIKGRILALNTLVLSKMWYQTAVIPISTADLGPIYCQSNLPDYLNKIKNICKKYVWDGKIITDENEIARCNLSWEILEQEYQNGGIKAVCIASKSLAMRSKQINEVIDPTKKLPSTRSARYNLADDANFCNANPNLNPIRDYQIDNVKITTEYKPIANLAKKPTIAKLYDNTDLLPTTKKIYNTLLKTKRPDDKAPTLWKNEIGTFPSFENSFKDYAPYKAQETLWKIRHFCLVRGDKTYSQNKNDFNVRKYSCEFCKINDNLDSIRESHLHVFYTCKSAKAVWNGLKEITRKIDPENVVRKNQHTYHFLGTKTKRKKDLIFNTLVSLTVNNIWNARCKLKHEKILITTQNILNKIIQSFKLRIIQFYEISRKNEKVRNFKRNFQIDGLFTIGGDEKIVFNF